MIFKLLIGEEFSNPRFQPYRIYISFIVESLFLGMYRVKEMPSRRDCVVILPGFATKMSSLRDLIDQCFLKKSLRDGIMVEYNKTDALSSPRGTTLFFIDKVPNTCVYTVGFQPGEKGSHNYKGLQFIKTVQNTPDWAKALDIRSYQIPRLKSGVSKESASQLSKLSTF